MELMEEYGLLSRAIENLHRQCQKKFRSNTSTHYFGSTKFRPELRVDKAKVNRISRTITFTVHDAIDTKENKMVFTLPMPKKATEQIACHIYNLLLTHSWEGIRKLVNVKEYWKLYLMAIKHDSITNLERTVEDHDKMIYKKLKPSIEYIELQKEMVK